MNRKQKVNSVDKENYFKHQDKAWLIMWTKVYKSKSQIFIWKQISDNNALKGTGWSLFKNFERTGTGNLTVIVGIVNKIIKSGTE